MRLPLELRHLRTLVALRSGGSLSRAATLLNLTQSALSHQIKLLETLCDAPLFERKTTPIRFTPVGHRLLELADVLLPKVDEAARDIVRLASGRAGRLRIAVECHTCFDWLMPAMDLFRERWPDVELDIVSGFHADPVGLIFQDRADLAIVGDVDDSEVGVVFSPLFAFDMVAVLAKQHPLSEKPWLEPKDFADQTLITYSVPDDMLDIMRQVLTPAGVNPDRRTTELTVVLMQLVASGRGVAVVPSWVAQSYLEKGHIVSTPIGRDGIEGRLYATCLDRLKETPYLIDFIQTIRETSFLTLAGVRLF